jgi:signal transduction histidine kinase
MPYSCRHGCGIRSVSVDPAQFVAQGHFGLAGKREWAAMIGGRLNIQTAVEYGTVVVVELPTESIG